MIKKGDKLLYKGRSTECFTKNNYYCLDYTDGKGCVFRVLNDKGYDIIYFVSKNEKISKHLQLWNSFCTPQELRKLKLKQLNKC